MNRQLTAEGRRASDLRSSPMMAHLLDALEVGTDIGHYGRLTFAMIARHFMDEEELVTLLAQQPDQDEAKARALLLQVSTKGYSPPTRERIIEWQRHQEFPICPSHDPDAGNVYRDLKFPNEVYQHINEYYEEKVESRNEPVQ
jgi:hypothetical protein